MLHPVKTTDIPWIAESARQFGTWLVHEAPGGKWTEDNLKRPAIYRGTVSRIQYESVFNWLWPEQWFQDGVKAFGIMALEREGLIELLQRETDGALFVRCPDGAVMEITAFLNGESLSFRHDPEYADLSWDPVSSMAHLLSEYGDD